MQAAFEPEFTIGRRESSPAGPSIPDRLIPIDDSLCYSSTGFHLAHDFTMELVEALEAQGLVVEHYYPELGHGQHEMSIRYADALRAADNHVLYRETVRGVAFRHGLWASLAPKPIPDQAGNGTHLHASLIDLTADGEPGGRNVFADPADRNGLSQTGYHFIGGLLAHLPALVALTCASVNSYRRLAPQMWASAYTCYGMDNREAAIRICSPLRGDSGSSVNLELKPSDSSANPYLALGGFIYAGPGRHPRQDRSRRGHERRPGHPQRGRAGHRRRAPPARLAQRGAGRAERRRDADGRARPAAQHGLPGRQALRGGPLRALYRPLLRVLPALHQDLITAIRGCTAAVPAPC